MLETSQSKQLKDQEKIIAKIERERTKKIKRYQEKTAQNIKNLEREEKGKKVVEYKKEPKKMKRYKDRAIKRFQEFIRYRDCNDENRNWIMIDVEEFRNVHGCDAGHYFPKKNYPQLIFNEDNVHAQTWWWNYRQLNKIWLFYEDRMIERIWQERYDALRVLARNKELKYDTSYKTQKFYEDMYEKYSEKLLIYKS